MKDKWIGLTAFIGLILLSCAYSWLAFRGTYSFDRDNARKVQSLHLASERSEDDNPDARIANWTEALAILTGLLALISAIQIIYLVRAEHTARITANSASRSADAALSQVATGKDVAAAAVTSADAARDHVEVSREAMIATNRAFVFCERIISNWIAKKETEEIIEWIFYPVWKNCGKTPTKKGLANLNTWVAVDRGDLPTNFDFPDYGRAESILIGPDLTRQGAALQIPLDTLRKIRDGSAHAYMWGWIDYNSVFPADLTRHRTEFCIEIQVTGNPQYKEGGFAYRAHGPFNGFDDECYRNPMECIQVNR